MNGSGSGGGAAPWRGAALALGAVLAAAVALGACSLPSTLHSVLFEPAPPPTEVVRPPRRAEYKPPPPRPKPVLLFVTERPNWPALLAQLPKDGNDLTDWTQALDKQLIQPKPGLDDKAEDETVLDLDLELVPADSPDYVATYPHKRHTELLACANCHTGIFEMEKGKDPITMDKIFAGEYCGRCHGKVAFDAATNCPRCHRALPK